MVQGDGVAQGDGVVQGDRVAQEDSGPGGQYDKRNKVIQRDRVAQSGTGGRLVQGTGLPEVPAKLCCRLSSFGWAISPERLFSHLVFMLSSLGTITGYENFVQ